MTGEDFDLEFGPIVYKNDTARFMDTVMPHVSQQIAIMSENPSTIRDAFALQIVSGYTRYTELSDAFLKESKIGQFDTDDNWRGEDPGQIMTRLFDFLTQDEGAQKFIDSRTNIVDVGMGQIDLEDDQNVQMVVIRDRTAEEHETKSFSFLVVYPPVQVDGHSSRQCEISFPTAMCHSVSAFALLDDSFLARAMDSSRSDQRSQPKEIAQGEGKYTARAFKFEPVSDEQLDTIVSTHGRTIPDRIIQSGLKIIDKFKKRLGEHIDPISALRDQQYALFYSYACHRGVGHVVNQKVTLPPIQSQ